MRPRPYRLIIAVSVLTPLAVAGAALASGWPALPLTPTMQAVLSLLIFAPLCLTTYFEIRRQRPIWQQLVPEGLALLGAAAPLLNGYAVLIVLVVLNLMPRPVNPPSLRDPLLREPNDWATLLALAFAIFSAWEIWVRPRGWGRMAERLAEPADREAPRASQTPASLAQRLTVSTRRVTLLLALCVAVLLAWPLNGFAGTWLLVAAGYLWPWIEPRRLSAGRALNGMLALGGLLPFIGAVLALATEVGAFWWWSLLAGAAYGLYPFPIVLVFCLSAAVLVRWLRLGLSAPPTTGLSAP